MKKILAALLALVSSLAFGTTLSPITLLNPAGSSSGQAIVSTGASSAPAWAGVNAVTLNGATFAAPGPIGSTTPGSGAFTALSSTSAPTLGATTFFPTVSTNTALQALSTLTTSTVTRLGFAAAGDVPPLTYTASGSACSLNAGAGDNGSQVQSSNGKCWIANFPPGPLDVTEWGVKADSTTDNTTALQAAWNYGGTVGTDILLPTSSPNGGYVKFSSITAPIGSYASPGITQNPLSGIRGRGPNQTALYSTVTGTSCAITFNPPNVTYSRSAMGRVLDNFSLYAVTAGGGYGICLNQITGGTFGNFQIWNFARGISAIDTISIRLENPQFFANGNAIYGGYNGNSYPNQWVIVNPLVGNSTLDSFYFVHPTNITILGGDFEGNNSARNTSYSTIHIFGNPLNGSQGLSVFGGYFENNGGNSDILIDQQSGDPGGSHFISGITDNRINNTSYVNSPVALFNNGTGITRVDVRGVGFLDTGTYVQSSARQYIAVSSPSSTNYRITGYDSNFYTSSTASPWDCGTTLKCMNLPDGHIMQWGTATTASGTPGSVAVTWPLACPNAVDTLSTSGQNGAGAVATGAASITTTGATLYTSSGPAGLQWQLLCH